MIEKSSLWTIQRHTDPNSTVSPFSRAVEQDLLSDYKVVVLAMSEQEADAALQTYRIAGGKEININDATKIVGCWRALQNPERRSADDPEIKPLTRAHCLHEHHRELKEPCEPLGRSD